MPAHTWEFPSMSLIVARSHLLSKALSLCISKGRMSEWKLSLVSNLFSHPQFTLLTSKFIRAASNSRHPLNPVDDCSLLERHTLIYFVFFWFWMSDRESGNFAHLLPRPPNASADEWNASKKPALCGRLLRAFGRAFGRIISSVNLSSVNRAEPSVENYNETCEPWRFLFLSRRW